MKKEFLLVLCCFFFLLSACKQNTNEQIVETDSSGLSSPEERDFNSLKDSLKNLQNLVREQETEISELNNVIDEYIATLNGVYLEKEALSRQMSEVIGNDTFVLPKVVMFAGERIDISSPKIRERFEKIFQQELKNARTYISRSGIYFPLFEKIFTEEKVPFDLKYLAVAESALNPMARSWAGAEGMWQFMPSTAKEYKLRIDNFVDERRDLYKSTRAAVKLLKFNKSYFAKKGADSWLLAMCAYNAGLRSISNSIKQQGGKSFSELIMQAEETNRYVWRAVAIKIIFEYEKEIFGEPLKREPSIYEQFKRIKLTLRGYHNLDKWAIAQGTNISTVWENNFWIKIYKRQRSRYAKVNNIILPFGEYEFWIPRSAKPNIVLLKEVETELAKKNDKINIYYRVEKGDDLVKIAKKFKTYTDIIRKENKINGNKIFPGQILTINGRYIKGDYVYGEKKSYKVLKGESLKDVAKKLNVSPNYLININNLEQTYVLYPGDKLIY